VGLAVRLAVLFVLLGVRYAWRPPSARGLAVQIPQTPAFCLDNSAGHRAHVLANGGVRINGNSIDPVQLPATLAVLYADRGERVLFLSAEPAAAMQSVTGIIDIAAAQVEVIAIVPPSMAMVTCMNVKPPWQKSP
jgi:biopolymer transport protein ExbD